MRVFKSVTEQPYSNEYGATILRANILVTFPDDGCTFECYKEFSGFFGSEDADEWMGKILENAEGALRYLRSGETR